MWIEAILPAEDLRRAISDLAPLTIQLGDAGGELALDTPSEVSLVAGQGVRIVCTAQLHWPVLGLSVPVTMNSLTILLVPIIESHEGGDALVFKLEIEHADIAMIPTAIDNRITSLVNEELAKKHVELSWNYSDTLNHVFNLPALLQPAESLALVVTSGVVKVTPEAVGLAVQLRSDVRRKGDAPPPDAPPPTPRPAPPPPEAPATASSTDSGLLRGVVAALALGAVFALGRASRTRRGWRAR